MCECVEDVRPKARVKNDYLHRVMANAQFFFSKRYVRVQRDGRLTTASSCDQQGYRLCDVTDPSGGFVTSGARHSANNSAWYIAAAAAAATLALAPTYHFHSLDRLCMHSRRECTSTVENYLAQLVWVLRCTQKRPCAAAFDLGGVISPHFTFNAMRACCI